MSESISEADNDLEVQNGFLFGGFQRVSSYDPNMCTTAARLSPLYEKHSTTPLNKETGFTYKNVSYVQSNEETASEISKAVHPPYLQNEILVTQQHTNSEVFPQNSVSYNDKNQTSGRNKVEIDYVQQDSRSNNETTEEPIGDFVLHRSPNGHLYQNFENGNSGEIVEFVLPYEFPTECHMEAFEPPTLKHKKDDDNQRRILESNLLNREQQRVLLESTMSPLFAAVNDITQRDAELLSYLNQHAETEVMQHIQKRNEYDSRSNRSSPNDEEDYTLVPDKPIETRAKATLPTNYLYFGAIRADTNEPSVYAKKLIPQKTKFGPFVGETRYTDESYLNILRSEYPRHYPLLLLGKSKILIVTNENTSNWMRFVRLAQSYTEQNLHLVQEDNQIYFKCVRDIHSKEELRVGYNSSYAEKYYLPSLEPSIEDKQIKFKQDNPWMCFECDHRFPTSQEMQKHLKIHDLEDAKCLKNKRKIKRKQKLFKKLSELPKNSSRCLICSKVFMTNESLKKHFASHLTVNKAKTKVVKITERSFHKCPLCIKKFVSEEKLAFHQKTHVNINKDKPHKCPSCEQRCATPAALSAHIRSHTNRLYSCIYCQESFRIAADFKKHVSLHLVDGSYSCVYCKKKYREYHLVRKHVRIFHPAVKYPCNECDRLFLHLSFLRRHKATHAKKNASKCAQCEEQFEGKERLNDHIQNVHKAKLKSEIEEVEKCRDDSSYLKGNLKHKCDDETIISKSLDQHLHSKFKCDTCKLGFKRRGMLVNHMVKKHPKEDIDSIEELNQPIIKLQTIFICPYCPKSYKNNAKRKAHILKNHPDMDVPPSIRNHTVLDDVNVQTVGCLQIEVQKCQLCYKQYGSRIRLLTHYRKAHNNEKIPEISPKPSTKQISIEEQCTPPVMDMLRPPVSPENKLLKLSSAALELSSIEDRKFFDFLNERSDPADISDTNRSSYKIVDSEFGETSNTELARLPELFEETIKMYHI